MVVWNGEGTGVYRSLGMFHTVQKIALKSTV